MQPGEIALVVVDVQEKFAPVIDAFDATVEALATLIRGCRILGVPILATEQYPKGLGPTVAAVRDAWEDEVRPIEKTAFSCLGEREFLTAWEGLGRSRAVVAGIESHVCVFQTCRDFLARGVEVDLVVDAVSSRRAVDREIGIRRAESFGARVTSVECLLFDLLGDARAEAFRAISRLVK